MILGLPTSTFFAFALWPVLWLGLAAYFYINFDHFEKKQEKMKVGGDKQ